MTIGRDVHPQLDGSTATDPERGNWIQTYTGRRFYILNPNPEDIQVEDVAHALSNLCRFTGHTNAFYSVAEHCVHVSKLVESRHALWGLLHDVTEAYIGDVSRPLKHAPGMGGYCAIESNIERAVLDRFRIDLTPEMERDVKKADLYMLCVEARELLGIKDFKEAGWSYYVETPLNAKLECWTPAKAKQEFIQRFGVLVLSRARFEREQ